MQTNEIVVAVDPGDKESGLIVLQYGEIVKAGNYANDLLFNIMLECETKVPLLVLIEDIAPYAVDLRQSTIDTIKCIGMLEYRLKTAKIDYQLVPRWRVKEWVFNSFPEIAIPRIEEKIKRNGAWEACDIKTKEEIRVTRSGERWRSRKASNIFVDDRIVVACMKKHWEIPTPKPGQLSKYGLGTHSWQALAVASLWIDRSRK